MDPRRALTERNAHFTRGPRFFREGGKVMFEFVIDAGNVLGPRPAVEADQKKHPDAWRALIAAGDLSVLDRDADGAAGGSLPESLTETVDRIQREADEAAEGGTFVHVATGIQAPTYSELMEQVQGQPTGGELPKRRKPRGNA